MKIWTFGPENEGANIVVDMVKGAQYLNEIRDSVCSAFQNASKNGILADENMRGCRFNIVDVKVHADAVHRSGAHVKSLLQHKYSEESTTLSVKEGLALSRK
jgi:elongation factor 2